MPANRDYKDLFRILNEEHVEYLIVGAHAVIYYAEPINILGKEDLIKTKKATGRAQDMLDVENLDK